MCECKTWAGYGPESFGKHHHANCPKRKTEKFPYLFYYEEGVDAFIPAPDLVDEILDAEGYFSGTGDTQEIIFKRIDLTDHDWANLPDAD